MRFTQNHVDAIIDDANHAAAEHHPSEILDALELGGSAYDAEGRASYDGAALLAAAVNGLQHYGSGLVAGEINAGDLDGLETDRSFVEDVEILTYDIAEFELGTDAQQQRTVQGHVLANLFALAKVFAKKACETEVAQRDALSLRIGQH